MKLVFIAQHREKTHTFSITFRVLAVWVLLFSALVVSVSFYAGSEFGGKTSMQNAVQRYLARMEHELSVLNRALEEVKTTQDLQLYAYSVRIAKLQARISELSALGEQISEEEYFVHGKELDFQVSEDKGLTLDKEGRPTGQLRDESFETTMEGIEEELKHKSAQLEVLRTLVTSKRAHEGFRISGYPMNGIRWVSSRFGYRLHPIYKVRRFHAGVDIATPSGNEIFTTANGIVTYAGYKRGYGNVVDVDHGGGVTTRYAHLLKVIAVKGQVVRKNDVLGLAGSTGVSTGSHLHYEVRIKGKPIDPYPFVMRK